MSEPKITRHADRESLAGIVARLIATALDKAIHGDGQAVLAVSGGSTPRLLFQQLSKADIDWSRVTVVLVDERFVPPSHDRSNHRLVATQLLQNAAAFANFIPLFSAGVTPAEAAADASQRIEALGQAPDVVLLGLGTDGHTASWFPESPDLAAVTDPKQKAIVLPVEASSQPEPRLTITQPSIRKAKQAILHIEGEAKMEVLEQALKEGPVAELPVRAILKHTKKPLQVHWAP